MIGAARRGEMAGLQVGQVIMARTPEQMQWLGRKMYTALKDAGYAHLDPLPDFLTGFSRGLTQAHILMDMQRETLI